MKKVDHTPKVKRKTGIWTPHPFIQELLDIPVYTGTRASLAKHLHLANSTMSAPNGLTLRIRKKLLVFIDDRLRAHKDVVCALEALRDKIGQIKV